MSNKLSGKKKIIGISCYYHDSAAALIINGEIISAVQEERFTRKKHDSSFPKEALKYCLTNNHLTLKDLNISPIDIEKAMIKWLVRFRDRGQFSLEKPNEKS